MNTVHSCSSHNFLEKHSNIILVPKKWYANYKHSLSTASSGTVTINADSTVQILAEEAHPLDRFDPQVRHYCTVFRDCSLIYI